MHNVYHHAYSTDTPLTNMFIYNSQMEAKICLWNVISTLNKIYIYIISFFHKLRDTKCTLLHGIDLGCNAESTFIMLLEMFRSNFTSRPIFQKRPNSKWSFECYMWLIFETFHFDALHFLLFSFLKFFYAVLFQVSQR